MELGNGIKINLQALLESRLLVQARSGAGKSWLLRRLLEQTHGSVQQLVIDPDGEFATLREHFDYVICAPKDGDVVADPKTAGMLARKLLETGVSAILDIYDLPAHARVAFVKNFCASLVDSPRPLWHSCIIVLDEAHIFAPEAGRAESAGAVSDLATRGRKRGFCLCAATQRIAALDKNVAAQLGNKLIGGTTHDNDLVRAIAELGWSNRLEGAKALRTLDPGEFYVYGPAFSREVQRVKVGTVKSKHPEAGARLLQAPPRPSAKIMGILGKALQDIPKQAQEEARTMDDLQAKVRAQSQQITTLTRQAAQAGPSEQDIEAAKLAEYKRVSASVWKALEDFPARFNAMLQEHLTALGRSIPAPPTPGSSVRPAYPNGITNGSIIMAMGTSKTPAAKAKPAMVIMDDLQGQATLRSGALRMLAGLVGKRPAGYTRAQVATLTGFKASGGTFKAYYGDLRRAGYIEERDGMVYATEQGAASLGKNAPTAPSTHQDVMALWRDGLRSGAFRMLEIVVANPAGIDRESLAGSVDMELAGGTFKAYLGDLRRNGLIEDHHGRLRAASILYP